MSLHGAPMLYIFFETHDLASQRELLESAIGLTVIEIEPHLPHHHHGVIKYDSGGVIISLNLSGPGRFPKDGSDGVVTVFNVSPEWTYEKILTNLKVSVSGEGLFTDEHGHHFMFHPAPVGRPAPARWPVVEEFRLRVRDIAESVSFYRDVLGLELLEETENTARFATGTVGLALEVGEKAADGRRILYDTSLLVFYCENIQESFAKLLERGLQFRPPRVDYNEVGGTVRFDDPSGHQYCLYEPSKESLTWESGPKVLEIAARNAVTVETGAN
jgi:catechol 2,3-dioxygenase-like lactoylglutathione lyase family enzyme